MTRAQKSFRALTDNAAQVRAYQRDRRNALVRGVYPDFLIGKYLHGPRREFGGFAGAKAARRFRADTRLRQSHHSYYRCQQRDRGRAEAGQIKKITTWYGFRF
ncbi:MAG: hypothetical protein AMXMBFR82_14830 [Candidatus Hydrogenedentota bacterium]